MYTVFACIYMGMNKHTKYIESRIHKTNNMSYSVHKIQETSP